MSERHRCGGRKDCLIEFSAMLCLYKNNIAKEVEEALNSAFVKQSLRPLELIAVYDGPVSDEVKDVIDKFENHTRVRRVVFTENRGHGPARAAAIDACETDWIAVIDADDVSRPERFELLAEAARQYPDCAVIGGGYTEFQVTESSVEFGGDVILPEAPDDVLQFLQSRSPIAQPTAILRVAAIRDVGNYQAWFNNEDYFLWLRLASAGYPMRNIPNSILLLRANPCLYERRGGFRYWLNEVSLQYFSLRNGTTTIAKFFFGAFVRFLVQVLMPNKLRILFYRRVLRRG